MATMHLETGKSNVTVRPFMADLLSAGGTDLNILSGVVQEVTAANDVTPELVNRLLEASAHAGELVLDNVA